MADHFHSTLNVDCSINPALLQHITAAGTAAAPQLTGTDIARAALGIAGELHPTADMDSSNSSSSSSRRATRSTTSRSRASAQYTTLTPAEAAALAADDRAPDLAEVQRAIKSLCNTSPGRDEISAPLLKLGGEPVAKWLQQIIAKVWSSGSAPQSWRQALMIALFKKGDRTLPDNYRGITLLEVCGKVYVGTVSYTHLTLPTKA